MGPSNYGLYIGVFATCSQTPSLAHLLCVKCRKTLEFNLISSHKYLNYAFIHSSPMIRLHPRRQTNMRMPSPPDFYN